MFDFKPLSDKAWDFVVNSTARINLASGAVRSGKTIGSIIRWIELVKKVPDHYNMLMVGKTERTLKRNVIDVIIDIVGTKNCYLKMGSGEMILYGKRVYIAGANDERSQEKIRGMTLYSAYCDELSLYPESFFVMLLTRLSMTGSMLFATTNPDSPKHWLKKKYIDKKDEMNFKYWHFNIEDNTALDPEYIENMKKEFSGVWYKRFIEGQWVAAEGAIYPGWNEFKHTLDIGDRKFKYYIVGIDYGTTNPTAFELIGFDHPYQEKYVVKEYYFDSRKERRQKTDSEYADDLIKFITGYRVGHIYVDPAAASFIVELRKRGILPKNGNNDVLSGIRFIDSTINKNLLYVDKSCTNLLEEMIAYSWDDKYAEQHGEDKPIKEFDHACLSGDTLVDTTEGQKKIKDLVGKTGHVYSWDGEQKCIKPFNSVCCTRENAEVIEIVLEDGRTIKCTPDHRLLTQYGLQEAKDLTNEDAIWDMNQNTHIRVLCVDNAECEDVYNMYVEDTHKYSIFQGLTSKNCDSLRYAIFTHCGSGPIGILGGTNYR